MSSKRGVPAGLFLLSALTLMTPQDLSGQIDSQPIVIGERFTLKSEILGEDRAVLVHRPNGYDQSEQVYPVLYLLDGDAHFHHTTGIVDFLANNGEMPQMLVVALPNTDRTRDLTPKTSTDTANNFPTAGGADKFLAFLTEELAPFVDNHYRTAPFRVLVGHSFGGLFAVHALLTQPESFDAYVAISPSLWWNDGSPVAAAKSFFTNHSNSDRFLFLSMGDEGGAMLSNAWEFAAVLEEKAPEMFDWEFALMDEETHGSILHRSTYRALERLYRDWQITDFERLAQQGGLDAFDAHYAALSQRFGYPVITPENTVNRLGYWHLGQEQTDLAISVFRRNVAVYPESANVYDSLGDGYDAAGQLELARQNYAKAVKLAEATSHPALEVYRNNLARIKEKIGTK
jgi:predicted alpha/beta superfamily hydrolase